MANILEEAMADAKLLKRTAIENAKNVLVEAISPQIKEFVDEQIGESDVTLEMPIPEEYEEEEGEEEYSMEPEEEGFMAEMPEELMKYDIDQLKKALMMKMKSEEGEGEGEMEEVGGYYESVDLDEEKEMAEAQEVVEITEEDLKEAFTEVLHGVKSELSEADVSKGFADVQNPNLNAKGGLGDKNAPGERGIEDKEKETMWKDEEPPAAKDWYGVGGLKEGKVKRYIYELRNAISKVKNENLGLKRGISELRRSLTETNLFNCKLLYTNKLINGTRLNNEQRINVVEAFDRAVNLREVELVFKSLSESFKIAGVLGESRKRTTTKRPRGSRILQTSVNRNLLQEGLERETGGWASRMQTLAGLDIVNE